jgi:hypothetical protein
MPELVGVSRLMNPRQVVADDGGEEPHDCDIGQWVFSETCQSGQVLTVGLA